MATVWLDLLALLLYGPLVVLIHELGHAAFARLGGFRVTDFAIGMGRPLWRLELRGGAVLHLDRWLIAGGSCTAIPVGPSRGRRAWFHAGGGIAQILLALALLPLVEHRLVQQILVFDAIVLLHNAIPWRIGPFVSDGWQILDLVIGGTRGADILGQRLAVARMGERAEQVGSALGAAYARICVAWADVIAGAPQRADTLFREDPPATTLDPWVDALYHYVRAEWDRAQGRPLGALRTTREAGLSVELSDVAQAQALIALAEARALVDLDAPAQAMRALSRAAGVGGAIGWQASVTLLWASLDASAEDLELATQRVVQRAHLAGLDRADGAMALWEASAQLDELGRLEAARSARAASRQLARSVLAQAPQWARIPLAQRMGPVAGGSRPETATGGGRI